MQRLLRVPETVMSRRASVFARQNPGKRRVRFPDEVVFEESIKESDGMAIMALLRRASVDIDVNRINMAGMTALHQVIMSVMTHKTPSHFTFVFLGLYMFAFVFGQEHVCTVWAKYNNNSRFGIDFSMLH